MGCGVTSKPFYTLSGQARDIETIIRLRSWMEDEVRNDKCDFSTTSLITDYNKDTEIFDFKINFFQ